MTDVVRTLRERLPRDEVVTDPDILTTYARDQASLCDFAEPLALVRARSVESVVETLRAATATTTPVVTRGAGTGLSGGANATAGAIVLSLEKMNRIIEIDPQTLRARVEAGVLNAALDEAAREVGLMYAPDPASREISTIGGNVATNAGGACCLKYGVTGDHIAAMTTVLASGEVIHTGSNTVKNVAGLDLHRLLIGSEGTLGVIVEVVAKLMPRRVNAGTLIAFFPKLEGAGHAIVDLARPQNLSKLEVMDQTTIRAVDALMGLELDTDAAAMLIAQVDTVDAESILAACESSCETHGASLVYATDDEQEGRSFMRARSAALPALEKLGRWLLDDVAVPIPRIPDLLAYCERTAANAGIRIGTFGHAGDGNLHPTLVYNEDQESAAERAFDQIIAGALELGGTVTGEHGVGLLKRRHLASMLGARELELMRGIKHVFDPKGLLNPGKGF